MGFGGGLLVGVFGGGGKGLTFLLFSRPPLLVYVLKDSCPLRMFAPLCSCLCTRRT
jgi:hypothetical protein